MIPKRIKEIEETLEEGGIYGDLSGMVDLIRELLEAVKQSNNGIDELLIRRRQSKITRGVR